MKKTNSNNSKSPRARKLTVEKAATALVKSCGMITHAAKLAGVDYKTLKRFMGENPDLFEVMDQIALETADNAELGILKLLEEGEPATLRWYADRKMRDRGYGAQTAVTGPNGSPIQHEVRSLPDFRAMTDDQLAAYEAMQVAFLEPECEKQADDAC